MEILKTIGWLHITYAIGLLVLGFIIAKSCSALFSRAASKRFSAHQVMLVRRLIFYTLFLIFVICALQELGFQLTILLGAAGLLTVALGFASQTAASNLISGFFLLFERPFRIGDTIQVKNFTGVVDSIDLLSTKIKTADNTLIRIPNETLMKSEITNTSFYNNRRVELTLRVEHKTNIEKVKSILLNLIKTQDAILNDPEPMVVVDNLTDAAIELKLLVWTLTGNASKVKNLLYEQIKNCFEEENIILPNHLREE